MAVAAGQFLHRWRDLMWQRYCPINECHGQNKKKGLKGNLNLQSESDSWNLLDPWWEKRVWRVDTHRTHKKIEKHGKTVCKLLCVNWWRKKDSCKNGDNIDHIRDVGKSNRCQGVVEIHGFPNRQHIKSEVILNSITRHFRWELRLSPDGIVSWQGCQRVTAIKSLIILRVRNQSRCLINSLTRKLWGITNDHLIVCSSLALYLCATGSS